MAKTIAKNKKAFHDYVIEARYEAGLSLVGSEVKSLRLGRGSISEGYGLIREGQAWLVNVSIPTLAHASYMNHGERRDRKLLLHRKEIDKLDTATRQKGYTLIPLELYFSDNNVVKVEMGLARGKAQFDKRASAKERDAQKDIQRALRRGPKS